MYGDLLFANLFSDFTISNTIFRNNKIRGNTAPLGIVNLRDGVDGATLTNVTFINNSVGTGSAIKIWDEQKYITIEDCTFSDSSKFPLPFRRQDGTYH